VAAEARRRCGYRKIGASYLVVDGAGFPCGRFPLALVPCPLCDHRAPFTRGLQRITPKNVLHASPTCKGGTLERCTTCPLGQAIGADTAGLMWVGEKFYPSPDTFQAEAHQLGVSKRIPAIPKWFTVGTTWVFLAHAKGIAEECPTCRAERGHRAAAGIRLPWIAADCPTCDGVETLEHPGAGTLWTPAVFFACRPARVERIIPDTMPEAARAELRAQGYTLVEVPHDDPDHVGRAEDDG